MWTADYQPDAASANSSQMGAVAGDFESAAGVQKTNHGGHGGGTEDTEKNGWWSWRLRDLRAFSVNSVVNLEGGSAASETAEMPQDCP
jgi:hypothetical protein